MPGGVLTAEGVKSWNDKLLLAQMAVRSSSSDSVQRTQKGKPVGATPERTSMWILMPVATEVSTVTRINHNFGTNTCRTKAVQITIGENDALDFVVHKSLFNLLHNYPLTWHLIVGQ